MIQQVYEPQLQALLGTASHYCEAIVLELSAVPSGTALVSRILLLVRRGAQAIYNQFDTTLLDYARKAMVARSHPPHARPSVVRSSK